MCMCICVCVLSHFSHVQLFATLWTVVLWAPLSLGFSRQEYWNGLLLPPLGDLPTQTLNLRLLHFLDWQGGSSPGASPRKPKHKYTYG